MKELPLFGNRLEPKTLNLPYRNQVKQEQGTQISSNYSS